MLTSLELQGYRGFRDYRLNGFTGVNLLVGANNGGKTSILEAIQLLVSRGDPRVLVRSANRRGEVNFRDPDERPGRFPDITHFFFGHRLEPNARFRLDDDGGFGPLSASLVDPDPQASFFPDSLADDDGAPALALALQIDSKDSKLRRANVLSDGSLVLSGPPRRFQPGQQSILPPVELITIDAPSVTPLTKSWDQVLRASRESEVVSALQILEPDLKSILFLPGGSRHFGSPTSGVLLDFENGTQRVPLGSYGDGMRRLLEISVALVHTSGGFLLIDELDTGLHWTAMGPAWQMIVEAARRSSIQVFATTHSKDCLVGLDSMIRTCPHLSAEVSVHKIEPTLAEAVRLDATSIRTAIDEGLEMR